MNIITNLIETVKEILWKIKDYDRLEEDYCKLLCYVTEGSMSKAHYYWSDIRSEVEKAQSNKWYGYLKDDIKDLDTKKEIMEYISKL